MLTTRPLTDSFALAYALDPAFDLDRYTPVGGEATEDSTKKYMEEFERCVETQDYDPLCKGDEKPTLFWFRPIRMTEVDSIVAMNLGGQRASTAAFRLCLKRIDDPGLGAVELKRTRDPKIGGLDLVTEKVLDDIVAKVGDFNFVHFLGNLVFARSSSTSPKR